MAEKDMKQNIIRAAITLMEREKSKVEEVTVRDIAAEAGVGVGLINYHFGSKDELLRQCADSAVAQELSRFRIAVERLSELTPMERLREMSKRSCDYMAEHPELNRLSLITDLRRESFSEDNTDDCMAAFLPLVAEAGKTELNDPQTAFRTHILVHALQAGILRSASILERIGLDFYKKTDRDQFVDMTINQLFREDAR